MHIVQESTSDTGNDIGDGCKSNMKQQHRFPTNRILLSLSLNALKDMTKLWKQNKTAILGFPSPSLDFLYGPPDSAEIQQPADSQDAAHPDPSLASVQRARDTDSTNNAHTIAFTLVMKARITKAVITNCMIVNTVMNNPLARNLRFTCATAINIATNSSRVNVNLDKVTIANSVIMNSTMDDSNILNSVIYEGTVNWFNMPELVIDHGTVGNPLFSEFTPGGNNTLDSIQPLSAAQDTSQSTRAEISCTDGTGTCDRSTSSQSVVEANTTPVSECSTPYMSAAPSSIPSRKRHAKKSSFAGRRKRRKEPQSRGGNTNSTILQLLKACNYKNKSLSDKDARDVQAVADYLIADDCRLNLQAQVKTWNGNSLAGNNALGLPTLQKTPESAARYFELLQNGGLPTRSLELRIAQASLYAIYLEICRGLRDHKSEDNPRRTKGDKIETVARNIILDAAAEIAGKDFKDYRDQSGNFITEVLRWGKRWWSLASGVGLGVLIACSEELAVRM